jgi:hypothetical protein
MSFVWRFMMGKIRSAGASHQLFVLCDDLEDLNEDTRRYPAPRGDAARSAITPEGQGRCPAPRTQGRFCPRP